MNLQGHDGGASAVRGELRVTGRSIFTYRCPPESRALPADAGFVFIPHRQIWVSTDLEAVTKLVADADEATRAALDRELARRERQVAISYATDSKFVPPAADGIQFRGYQKAGIANGCVLFRHGALHGLKGMLLADDMGVGKTLQAIGMIGAQPDIRRALVVVPSSLRLNWLDEFRDKSALGDRTVAVWTSPVVKTLRKRKRESDEEFAARQKAARPEIEIPDANIIIVSYDMAASRFNNLIRQEKWDLVVFDEAHYLKNADSGRTTRLLGRPARKGNEQTIPPVAARFHLFLTGTPILNRPQELWPILRTVDPYGLGANFYRFATRYCAFQKTDFGYEFGKPAPARLRELNTRLRGTVMVRRLKSQVLTDLPPKIRKILRIEPTADMRKMIERHDEARVEIEQKIAEAEFGLRKAMAGDDPKAIAAAEHAMERAANQSRGALARSLHETALQKIPEAIEQIDLALESGRKIIVFAHHQDVVAALAKPYGKHCAVLTGLTDNQKVQGIVARFQHDPECRVMIANILKGGVGHTMTSASVVLFVELDWRDAITSQAEDRAHRIGQTETVYSKWLVLAGSADEVVVRAIHRKKDIARDALGEIEGMVRPAAAPDPAGAPAPGAQAGFVARQPAAQRQGVWRKEAASRSGRVLSFAPPAPIPRTRPAHSVQNESLVKTMIQDGTTGLALFDHARKHRAPR